MDPERLGELIDRHSAALVLFARQWCAAPEDVVQEAFIKLVRQSPAPHHPAAWLYKAVRNGAISQGRSERRRQSYEARAAGFTPGWFRPPDDPGGLDAEAAAEALAGLPLEQREPIVAHLWGGLTFEQIAELSGGSAATVWRRYTAGLAALRDRLRVPCPNLPTR
jgi:DNA-directed RNA polymerase specialized sigma24 family protein